MVFAIYLWSSPSLGSAILIFAVFGTRHLSLIFAVSRIFMIPAFAISRISQIPDPRSLWSSLSLILAVSDPRSLWSSLPLESSRCLVFTIYRIFWDVWSSPSFESPIYLIFSSLTFAVFGIRHLYSSPSLESLWGVVLAIFRISHTRFYRLSNLLWYLIITILRISWYLVITIVRILYDTYSLPSVGSWYPISALLWTRDTWSWSSINYSDTWSSLSLKSS